MHNRHVVDQLHWRRLAQAAFLMLPPGSLKEEALDVRAVLWTLREGGLLGTDDGEVPRERVHRHGVLARRRLHERSEKAGRVGEARQPEHGRHSPIAPVHQLLPSLDQVARPRGQRLERRVGRQPRGRHGAHEQPLEDVVQLGRHDHEPADPLAYIREREPDGREQLVVSLQLLHEHDVHRRPVALARLCADIARLGHQLEQVARQGVDAVVGRRTAAVGGAGLQRDYHLEHRVARLDLRGDVRVGVLPERLGPVCLRQAGAGLQVGAEGAVFGHDVVWQRRESVRGRVKRLVTEELVHVHVHQPPVAVVGHPAAIVDLGDEVLERLPRRLLVLVEVEAQAQLRHLKVRVVKVVRDVPTEVAKLAPVDEERVEPAHREEQLLVLVRLCALREARLGKVLDEPRHIGLEPLGRLRGHLDAALEDADREGRVRRRGEPQAEGGVRLPRRQPLHDLVELAEPGHHQVAVGEEHPVPLADALVDEAEGVRRLALAERDRVEGHLALLRQLRQLVGRVDARGEDKDERRGGGRVGEHVGEVKHRRLGEARAQVVDDEGGGGEDDAVGPEAPHEDQPLHLGAARLPLARQLRRLRLWLRVATPLVPVRVRRAKGRDDVAEGGQLVELGDMVPRRLGQPVGARVLRLRRLVEDLPTAQEEVALGGIHLASAEQDLCTDLEGEEQLVCLEEGAAGGAVHKVSMVLVQARDPLRQLVRLCALCERGVEEADIGVERELVHRVDPRQVGEDEVEDRGAVGARPVPFPRGVDLGLRLLRDGELLLHLDRGGLGGLEGEHECLVLEERAGRLGEHAQDGVLQFD
mmetsp:Transcript_8761/g.28873  ORF Transcript_8761/g.28873 Transcript_8761/m.28873 type:complete len:812 (+) Transcript_8761:355-2790(+)